MNKKIISDMITSKKTIRQIPVAVRKIPAREKVTKKEDENSTEQDDFYNLKIKSAPSFNRKPLNPKYVLWSIAGLCILALFFGISIIFSSATVTITPRTENITFDNESYVAKLNSAGDTDIAFEVLSVKQEAGEIVSATEEKEVTQKATGKIVIYNNYSTAPQRLINNTRFEAANGKVYRINSSVVVPGISNVGGKPIPGSIEAIVFADQPGEDYNMKVADLSGDFKIPGFKGDVRYNSFYARLKEDITGGFIGKQRIISEELRKGALEIIKIKLKEQLLKELYAVKPENYLIFKDGYSVVYTNLPDTAIDTDKAKINIEASLNGIVFNNIKLTKYLASKKIDNYDGLAAELIPADDLVTVITGSDSTGLWKNNTLQLKLTGNAVVRWVYDKESIKKDLAGKKEADLAGLVTKYKNTIKSIQVVFRPIWTRYFPDDLNKIKIQEQI